MKLPYRTSAYIPKAKLTSYLLSQTHPVGKFKAEYFRTIGFSRADVNKLEQSLLKIAHFDNVKEAIPSQHGTKYVIIGSLETPTGAVVKLETVWIIEPTQNRPRFVTAYPV